MVSVTFIRVGDMVPWTTRCNGIIFLLKCVELLSSWVYYNLMLVKISFHLLQLALWHLLSLVTITVGAWALNTSIPLLFAIAGTSQHRRMLHTPWSNPRHFSSWTTLKPVVFWSLRLWALACSSQPPLINPALPRCPRGRAHSTRNPTPVALFCCHWLLWDVGSHLSGGRCGVMLGTSASCKGLALVSLDPCCLLSSQRSRWWCLAPPDVRIFQPSGLWTAVFTDEVQAPSSADGCIRALGKSADHWGQEI